MSSSRRDKTIARAIFSGFLGACAITLVNEVARRTVPNAPRLDKLGEQAIVKGAQAADVQTPRGQSLQLLALAGDLALNTAYYSLIGLASRKQAPAMGTAMGLAGGLMATLLPRRIGLNAASSTRTPQTAGMTFLWYVIGGVTTALVNRLITR